MNCNRTKTIIFGEFDDGKRFEVGTFFESKSCDTSYTESYVGSLHGERIRVETERRNETDGVVLDCPTNEDFLDFLNGKQTEKVEQIGKIFDFFDRVKTIHSLSYNSEDNGNSICFSTITKDGITKEVTTDTTTLPNTILSYMIFRV